MITKEQAITCNEFHYGKCVKTIGPRGGEMVKQVVYRRNGKTQIWKTRPDEFRVPIKTGFYKTGQLTHQNSDDFHTRETCPLEN